MLIWLCARENTAKTSKPPTSFSTAETGNLQLARSAVLNCVTGAKWLTVLVSAGNAVQQDLTYRLWKRYQPHWSCFRPRSHPPYVNADCKLLGSCRYTLLSCDFHGPVCHMTKLRIWTGSSWLKMSVFLCNSESIVEVTVMHYSCAYKCFFLSPCKGSYFIVSQYSTKVNSMVNWFFSFRQNVIGSFLALVPSFGQVSWKSVQ